MAEDRARSDTVSVVLRVDELTEPIHDGTTLWHVIHLDRIGTDQMVK